MGIRKCRIGTAVEYDEGIGDEYAVEDDV